MNLVDKVDDLQLLLSVLPKKVRDYCVSSSPNNEEDLVEIIFDLGRVPEIRYQKNKVKLDNLKEVTYEEIESIVEKIGKFNTDNRAGIERTLHRISAIRNREGKIIGLTCRIGRAIYGTIEIIRDIIESNQNILFLGSPGVGKTTKLRETARVLADQLGKRVVVVDTSNEIAGDGDIPHPAIGSARRMQVPSPDRQHQVMIEAVENHMPEVVIVDEIGTEEETKAARTIAERGVQLVATAHGYTVENLLNNPTLVDLLGGIQSVVLGDEEAKFRGTQKTVLERKSPPTFDVLIEIRERDVFAIYSNLTACVDSYLRREPLAPKIRKRNEEGSVVITKEMQPVKKKAQITSSSDELAIFPFAINKTSLYSVIHSLQLPATIVSSIGDADIVLTTKSKMKSDTKIKNMLEGKQLPLHVLKQNSVSQIERFMRKYFKLSATEEEIEEAASLEIRELCHLVQSDQKPRDAAPRGNYIRRVQHEIISECGLNSTSVGKEPNRRVRIYS